MKSKEINLLIEHDEIRALSLIETDKVLNTGSLFSAGYNSGIRFTEHEFLNVDSQEKFCIGLSLYNFLEFLFNYFLEGEIEERLDSQKYALSNKLQMHGGSRNLKLSVYEKMIVDLNLELEKLPNFSRASPLDFREIKSVWEIELLYLPACEDNHNWIKANSNLCELIHEIKYKVFGGKQIYNDKKKLFETEGFWHIQQLEKYFATDNFKDIFNAAGIYASIVYLQKLIDEIDNTIRKPKKEKKELTCLEDAFINKDAYDRSITALKLERVVDTDLKFLMGRNDLGIVIGWVRALRDDKKYITKEFNDEQLIILLNKQFGNLKMSENTDGRTLRRHTNNSKKYYLKFKSIID